MFRLDAYLTLQSATSLGATTSAGSGSGTGTLPTSRPQTNITNQISGNTQSASVSFNKISDLVDALSGQNLKNYVNLYTDNSAVTTNLFIRGLSTTASYGANSTALRFNVPSIGIDLTFTGTTRKDSQSQFKDFLLKNGGDILARLMRELVATSPVDPVAGNPNSLQAQMNATSFSTATGFGVLSDKPSPQAPGSSERPNNPNLFSAGGDAGLARSGGYTTASVHLPLKYTISFPDPDYALTFDLPLTYVRTEGAQSGIGSFGASLRVPLVAERWYLSPSVRAGAAGSIDLGSAALMYSADLTSFYTFHATPDLKIGIGNGIGFYKTGGFSVSGYSFDYKLRNAITKNGISIEGPLDGALFERPISWQAYVTDTYAFGDRLYVPHYNELGLVVGTRHADGDQMWDSFRLGLTYTVGRNYNALKLNAGYRF
ncbi:hypothetical protein [Azospirillum sp. B510]|uniref:hypothetical protein n=1 Tax=Azospirillum sp. (strain B510) TaxID=137722 RepID=UPI0005AA0E2A|nr:hypothetical protein [Azospirillum sp. B510]